MLIPFGTNARIQHQPIATLAFMGVNVLLFLVTGMGSCLFAGIGIDCHEIFGECARCENRWLLLHYDTVNPLQWLTAAFMHASWVHLIGNMIFLWCFGLLVEGRLGTRRFAWMYLALALVSSAMIQVPLFILGFKGAALGASGAISALMVVALIWSPDDEMKCVIAWRWFYCHPMNVPIIGFVAFYGALQIIPLLFHGIVVSTPLLHLIGMAAGVPVAIEMMRRGWVNCEGADLFSRYGTGKSKYSISLSSFIRGIGRRKSRSEGMTYEERYGDPDTLRAIQEIRLEEQAHVSAPIAFPEPIPFEAPIDMNDWPIDDAMIRNSFERAVEVKNAKSALTLFNQIGLEETKSNMDTTLLSRYVELLGKEKMYLECLVPLGLLAIRRGRVGQLARLRIAKIQLRVQKSPDAALRTVQGLPAPWPPSIEKKRTKLLLAIEAEKSMAAASG